ncbi:subtilisin-like protease SBT5.4 [Manihot esculenta]|uniref:Subtilisin-like protease n=1 Tax=Manihot esculenta TaxID=3983 RepID=A0A2C9V8K8_MANES|nr:subtilisin-like protease SBT5.4 [Manihot esculenta]OAY41075.1 hypothetical protein MANES_09G072100v8 [Manihot esculenta]
MQFSKLVPLFLFFTLCFSFQTPVFAVKKSYVVYLGSHSHSAQVSEADLHSVTQYHHDFLGSFIGSTEKARDAIFYSYKYHINGFAAHLEEQEAAQIAKHPKVVSVILNEAKQLHTTHSWEFVLLEKNGTIHPSSLWTKAGFGEDVIIANLDTGVWPESKSFHDEGYGPVPSKWGKGKCKNETLVPCNRKLIGAQFFKDGYEADGNKLDPSLYTARDYEGHGSHTLSTVGGNFVPGASMLNVEAVNGTAKGGSPKARVAAYKVCWGEDGCYNADILAGFEAAIHDGVDVISVSLGGGVQDYNNDVIAIGAFHAMQKGIVVVCSAGNSGPGPSTVTNIAPWIITVGASTIDRQFQTWVELGNGHRFKGEGFTNSLPESRLYPLISGAQAKASNASAQDAELCKAGSLDHEKVRGKILACLRGGNARVDKGMQAFLAGAVGMILCNDKPDGNGLVADFHILPASHISYKDGLAVYSYINSTNEPVGYITPTQQVIGVTPAPVIASFSSVGPNPLTPEILKPDVTAPGVNIIAAFSLGTSVTGLDNDNRTTPYITMSGTSMSCPHVSGVVGLLKSLHPDWSPAAIRSAISTTARTRDNTQNPMLNGSSEKATPFSYGSGHIRPNRAMDPGLVYDVSVNDYLDFLCASGYNSTMIEQISESPYKCTKSASLLDFNYHSIAVTALSGSVSLSRKLKNVGSPGKYAVHIREPYGISVSVKPRMLKFQKVGEEKSFKVTLKPKWKGAAKKYEFGSLAWTDGFHYVRSPIVVSAAKI